jgi:leader peptidase (prepilin peptidase)/N-methyltransferase
VTSWLALPLEVRLAIVFALGLMVASAINWAIYALAYCFPRPISPWSRPDPKAPPRRWLDRVPVIGWAGLQREEALHGRWFWVRPMLLEIAFAGGMAALYAWEMRAGLFPQLPALVPPPADMLHAQFAAHFGLIAFMTVATFIDFDEQTIPDSITIPGTLAGLLFAAIAPMSLLPVVVPTAVGLLAADNLHVASPDRFPAWLHTWRGLAIACAGFSVWCLALVPATLTLRRGWSKGFQYYFASLGRRMNARLLGALAIIGCLTIALVWWLGGAPRWEALLTSLIGLVFGGGLVWAVRIVGRLALRKEAMGFGDVTLMAMIGSFLGWQPCLIVFFLSPVAALVISVGQWMLTGRRDIAFGPYLCLAAVFTIVRWADVWHGFAEGIFGLGSLVLVLLAVCLSLMLGLLMTWRIVEQLLFGSGEQRTS